MSNQTSSDSPAGPKETEVPVISSFEFAKGAIGEIKNSVNQFRGTVSLPVDFVTLPGHQGLDVKVTAIYSSAVKKAVATWNVEAPTGILGLGWDMPLEYITVSKNGSGSPTSDTYYLFTSGSAIPMVKVGEIEGSWTFQLKSHEFWEITYNPSKLTWTIVKEDGFIHTYGGVESKGAVQWGIKWGNWMGNSSLRVGQDQYALAWNLSSIESPWGQRVTYAYQNTDHPVGKDGLEFTQESYLKTIIDSFGRTVVFNYSEKYGANNPSPPGMVDGNIVEYQAGNTQPPELNAYQNRYETKYLESIDVINAEGRPLYSFAFNYSFFNASLTGDTNRNLLWKRCLDSVCQLNLTGATLPSMHFEYNGKDELNPGAIKSILYPTGGIARFTYKKAIIDAPKKISIGNPLAGSRPGVWHGSDYVVFTYCRPEGGMKVLVYSWNGRWVSQEIASKYLSSVKADPDSIQVITQADFIAVYLRNPSANRDEIYPFRRDRSQFGTWTIKQPFSFYLKSTTAGATALAAGTDFLIAYNKEYSSASFQRISYSWQDDSWKAVGLYPPSDVASASGVVLSALQNYYIIAYCLKDKRLAKFQIYYRDATGLWMGPREWSNTGIDIAIDNQQLLFSWRLHPAYAVATYAREVTSDKIRYSLRIFQWDERFYVQNPSLPKIIDLESPIVSSQSQYSIFNTIIAGSLVNNNLANIRNIGGSIGSNWLRKDFSPAPATSSSVAFACGDDVSVMSESVQGAQRQTIRLLTFNPNNPSDTGWITSLPLTLDGKYPTLSDAYLTIGSNIYFCDFNKRWNLSAPLQIKLLNLGDERSIQNRGPNYIAYQGSGTNQSSYVVILGNGQAKEALPLPNQKIYIPPEEAKQGTLLAGPRFLVSYPSSQTFNESNTLNLHNLDEGDLGDNSFDYPVAAIEIEDAIDPKCSFCQSFFYESSVESQIAYNPATGITQYPRVTVVPGIKYLDKTPPVQQPQGRSVYRYSNGLSPQGGLNYEEGGWIYNYQNLLNGALLAQMDYDLEGHLVSSHVNFWTVYTIDVENSRNLYGAYARMVRIRSIIDGIVVDTRKEYDPKTGLILSEEQTYYDFHGKNKALRTETLYARQVDEYKSAFNIRHMLNAVVQTTKMVVDQDTKVKNYIESTVTTYRNWAIDSPAVDCTDEASCRLGPHQTYKWTSPGSEAPEFDFSPEGDRSSWLLDSEVIRRTVPEGLIEEQSDKLGNLSSFIYDRNHRYLVAKFQNGSKEGDEISYLGFEDYESDQGWSIGSGATVIPNAQFPEVDSHTGSKSLRLAPSSAGINGLSRTFKPRRQDQPYLFSAWVKKPKGFDSSKGNASWQIRVAGGQPMTVQFPDIIGQWAYVYRIIDMPAGSSAEVEILGENANQSSYVLVDDLRFSPHHSIFEGYGYDTLFWQQNAVLGVNGEFSRTAYDEFQQPIVFTNNDDELSKIAVSYFSRQGNQGLFSATDPNQTIGFVPASGGSLFTFNRGSDWLDLWHGEAGVWAVQGGSLIQKSPQTAGTLSIDDQRYVSDYVLAVNFSSPETITRPLGLHLGQSLTVQWSPLEMEWQLLGADERKISSVASQIFAVSGDMASELNSGQIPSGMRSRFAEEGYPLPQGSTVSPGQVTGSSWVLISPDGQYRYYLILRSGPESSIGVCKVPGSWIALAGSDLLVFLAGGRTIFSYKSPQPFRAFPQLFFGNRVAISLLASGISPQAAVTFEDSRGIAVQSQLLADLNRVIATQTVVDDQGRQAVQTKAIYLDASANPLLKYCPALARLDWDTGIMSGLISDYYKDDKGYPYYRQAYETSPLGRESETGMPGELFRAKRAEAHTTRTSYSSVGISPEDGTKRFFKVVTTNPSGDIYYEIQTLLGQVIYKVSIDGKTEIKNATVFDDAGLATELRAPNYHNPPGVSKPEDWICRQTFDYAGRRTSSVERSDPPAYFIYDKAGNLRFSRDAQGAVAGTYNYAKYDSYGRQIEAGYVSGDWDSASLQAKADADPAWPPSPNTWKKRFYYDGSQDIMYSIGRVHEIRVNNKGQGQSDVIERLRYNLQGRVISHSLVAEDFSPGQEYGVDYRYNNAGNAIQITYPALSGGKRLDIYNRHNRLNQVDAISRTPDFSSTIAAYTYLPSGELEEERLELGSGQNMRRSVTYNSPLWPVAISQKNQAGQTLFAETLSYTEGGFSGAGYYDGTIAAASYQLASGTKNLRYSYDPMGQISNAENVSRPDENLGVKEPIQYDPNGNFLSIKRGDKSVQYRYHDHTERVSQVLDQSSGAILASCDLYDGNGNVKHYIEAQNQSLPGHDLTFEYDPLSGRAVRITDAEADRNTLLFRYGSDDERVLKEVQEGGRTLYKKLYLRGLNSYPLCELTNDGSTRSVVYIYGPGGLISLDKNNVTYGVIKDHLGSVRALVDQQSQVVASYDYQTFGSLTDVNEPGAGFMPYLFTGQEYDREIGLYNYRARFYSSELGRFLGVDPEHQFFSPYIYASNNPVRYIDPDGCMAKWAQYLLGGLLVAVGIAVVVLATVFTLGAASGLAGLVAPVGAAAFGAQAGITTAGATAASVGGAASAISMAGFTTYTVADLAFTIGIGAAAGAVAGACINSGLYALTSGESFNAAKFGQQAGLGAIAGAISGGVVQGLSVAGQGIASAATGITENFMKLGVDGALEAVGKTFKALGLFGLRNSLISGTSFFVGGAVSKSVEIPISNIWGLTDLHGSGMAAAIFTSAGISSAYGFGMGLALPVFQSKGPNWALKGTIRGTEKAIEVIAKKPWMESK